MKPLNLTDDQVDVLAFIGFADGSVDVHDLVDETMRWTAAVRIVLALRRRGLVDVIGIEAGRPLRAWIAPRGQSVLDALALVRGAA